MKKIILVLAIVASTISSANASSPVCKKIELGDGGDINHGYWTDYAIYCAKSAVVADHIELREITVEVVREDSYKDQRVLQHHIGIKATKQNAKFICKKLTSGKLLDYVESSSQNGVNLDGTVSAPFYPGANLSDTDTAPSLEIASCAI